MNYRNTFEILEEIKVTLELLEDSGKRVFKKVLNFSSDSLDLDNGISDSELPCAIIIRGVQTTSKVGSLRSYNRNLPISVLIWSVDLSKDKDSSLAQETSYKLEPLVNEAILKLNSYIDPISQDIFFNESGKNRFALIESFNYKEVINF